MPETKPPLSYKSAGVDIEAGDALVERIKPHVRRTRRPEWLGGLGGFGALFEVPTDRYRKPVLVSGTDGVGTKLKLAQQLQCHDTIGIDLVAMCVNDILASGAEPLYFLDYYATGKLDIDTAESVIKGIARGCEISGMSLVGGETAEMPGMYEGEDYDLAGFCVGIVEKDQIITGESVQAGDCVIALGSSGPHSNGYSLIRKVLESAQADTGKNPGDTTVMEALLAPTRIYTRSIHDLIDKVTVKAIAHITGGGIAGNLSRILPENTMAKIDTSSWTFPEVFQWLARTGNIDHSEMFRTFNCGIGMMLVVDSSNREEALSSLRAGGETAWCAGQVESHTGKAIVELHG